MSDLLTVVAIIFIVAGPFLLVANRFDLPTVPFLILAGFVAGRFIQEGPVLELAQYGIALLVFTFGVSIRLSAIRPVLTDSEVAALGQILVVGSLSVVCGLLLGIPPTEVIFFGIAAALSSTIVGRALLQSEIRRNVVRGRLSRSIHFVQDLIGVVFLLVLGAGTLAIEPLATQLGYGVAFLFAAGVVNKYLFALIKQFAGDSVELMIIGTVSLLVVFVGAAEFVGVSIVVGAFAAGLAVRYEPTEYLGLFNGLESIKDFFVAIFFVTIGALVTVATVEKVVLAGVLVVLTVVVKPAITTTILLYQGYEARTATLTSLSTDQVSEFALIIAIEALLLGLLTQSVFDAIILATAVTMITSSLSRNYDERIYRIVSSSGMFPGRHGKIDQWSKVPGDVDDHVIVVGYGRQSQYLVEALEELGKPYVVVENDPARRDALVSGCAAYVFGDAMEDYTWEKTAADRARVIISTVDSAPVSRHILSLDVDSHVILSASDRDAALDLLAEDALYVFVSDLLAGQRLVQYLHALADGILTPEELRNRQLTEIQARSEIETDSGW